MPLPQTIIGHSHTFSQPANMVKFLVGPTSQEFVIHKEVVCVTSQALKAAFSVYFTEGQSQQYRLEHVDETTFQLLMQWMYQNYVPLLTEKRGQNQRFLELCKLWVLAERFIMLKLQNYIIEILFELHGETYDELTYDYQPHCLKYIYGKDNEGTPFTKKGSQLRKLFFFFFADMEVNEVEVFAKQEDLPGEFIEEFHMYIHLTSLGDRRSGIEELKDILV
ncbi:hypothetical protein BGZ60DRAFT_432423 [Tricladium varicosporioides]|nr:hypothetical protein BGZ60DRAFT_432423 [Hymenoscyphus varicosporioides]